MPVQAKATANIKTSFWSRLRLWLWRGLCAFGLFWLAYACFLLLGFVPVNRGYQVPPEDDRVRIFIRLSDIHTDFVMPISLEGTDIDWGGLFPSRHFHAPLSGAKFVAVGWGSRGFYVDTKTWADLKIGTLLTALFTPSEAVLHVEYLWDFDPGPGMDEVLLTKEQYRELAAFVQSTIGETDANGAAMLATEVSYNDYDRFYLARGRYHMFNTCNQWTGRGLHRTGVPTGLWTPLVVHVRCQLPKVEKNASEH
jgi:uncharacterized protein (TIGR02117 family)